jgi:hypothetical protein
MITEGVPEAPPDGVRGAIFVMSVLGSGVGVVCDD